MFEKFITKRNLPSFRLKQLWQFYYQKGMTNANEITVWSKELRQELAAEVDFNVFVKAEEFNSTNGNTTKVLFTRKDDGKVLESVLMQHHTGRNTVCVSCMIGCPVGCTFCATGKLGFQGNLTADEIIEQVMYFQRKLLAQGQRVSNVVFMGMGEPLLNLDNVLIAVSILTDPEKLGISDRKIAISTAGYYRQFEKLIAAGFKGRLAISLHAPNQELREKIMPMAKANPLNELFKSIDEYVAATNSRIFYEYLLIEGVNNSLEHAQALAKLLKNRLAHVNLIPFNPISESSFVKSKFDKTNAFKQELETLNISVTIRTSMGAEIAGACGQLAGSKKSLNIN